MEPLMHGILLAFGLILPLGVQNIFIFNQGASQGTILRAMPAVLTAAICDTLLISLAVTGVSVIVFSFDWLRNALFIVGFFFLLYMGWTMWRTKSTVTDPQSAKVFSPKRQITFAASVSILNPHAIMDTIGVIGTSSLAYESINKWIFTIACIAVSWLWFIGLAILGRFIGNVDPNGKLILKLNQISALVIWGMAFYIGYTFLISMK